MKEKKIRLQKCDRKMRLFLKCSYKYVTNNNSPFIYFSRNRDQLNYKVNKIILQKNKK